jgi:ribosomal protein L11 methyltransferase
VTSLWRVAVRVPTARAEEARGTFVALAPKGFEDRDVGCGSGVLGIAAARLGFGPITCIDVDSVAVEATIANAAANGVAVEARVLDALRAPLPLADVAVANVLLAPVATILARLDARYAITSGYLDGERPAHPGWAHAETAVLDGWAADSLRKRH